jgi:thiamine pyrophosphokinase
LNWDISASRLQVRGDISANNFSGSGTNLTNLNPNNINGIVPVNKGGTGVSSFQNGQILVGNTDTLLQTNNLNWDISASRLQVRGDISANNFIGSGTNLTNLNPNNINGIVPVNKGGTGVSSFQNGQILVGNANSLLQTNNLNWDISASRLQVRGDISANNFIGLGTNLTNLNPNNINGIVPVNKGGTGVSSFQNGQILFGNANSVLQTNNLNWDNSASRLQVTGNISANNLCINNNCIDSNIISNLINLVTNIRTIHPIIRLAGMRGSGGASIDGGGLPVETLGNGTTGFITARFRLGIRSTLINDLISYAVLDNTGLEANLRIQNTSRPEIKVYFKTQFMNPFGTVLVLERSNALGFWNGPWVVVSTKNISASTTFISYTSTETGL